MASQSSRKIARMVRSAEWAHVEWALIALTTKVSPLWQRVYRHESTRNAGSRAFPSCMHLLCFFVLLSACGGVLLLPAKSLRISVLSSALPNAHRGVWGS